MLGFLRGKVLRVMEDYLLLDVGGVGYKVFVPGQVIRQCGGNLMEDLRLSEEKAADLVPGPELALFIETVVKEDSITLFGFATQLEQDLFNFLLGISGLGKKFAMKILSHLEPMEIYLAIENGDDKSFSAISGIGSKLAQRIITDLRGHKTLRTMFMQRLAKIGNTTEAGGKKSTKVTKMVEDKKLFEAVSALENLGYKHNDAFKAVNELLQENPQITLETLITESLKMLN